jgi:hypothetical protein
VERAQGEHDRGPASGGDEELRRRQRILPERRRDPERQRAPTGWLTTSTDSAEKRRDWIPPRKSEIPHETLAARPSAIPSKEKRPQRPTASTQ